MARFKIAPAALVAVICAAAPAAAAPVGPAMAPAIVKGGEASAVTDVRYRRWGGGYGRRHGRGIALGLGAAIVGGIIANEIYRPRRGYYDDDYGYEGPSYRPSGYAGGARELCAQNFRSFEWNTGLYTTYGGEKRVCPYLR